MRNRGLTRGARIVLPVVIAAVAAFGLARPVLAQWPTTCVDLNDIVEAHLGNDGNVGIYQRVFGADAEAGCQNDHRDDVRGVFGWAFDQAAQSAGSETQDLAWPTDCVELNDIVENHLGNHANVGIYQRTFGAQAETACRNDHRDDVRGVFSWAFGGAPLSATSSVAGPPLAINELVKRSRAAVRFIRTSDEGCGSAFVVTADGYLVTNSHVLNGARQAVVGTHDGQEQQAAVVADDAEADLALLKLPGGGHSFLPFGSSARLELGEDLVILGYPLCLDTLTVTRGVLSARHPSWLQTDATANPGNSGGPAFNLRGGVIGVVIGKLGGGAVEGVESANFLIDGDEVRSIIDDWITRHRAGSLPEPVSGKWASVSAGWNHTCGIRMDGNIACWGSNEHYWTGAYFGQATPPPGTFRTVSAGLHHTCGLLTDGTVTCWGDNTYGQSTPPARTFQSVSAGEYHSCGVLTDATVTCWGSDENFSGDGAKFVPMPSGTFQSVHAGGNHTCALQTNGTIACWGWNIWNRATAPSGIFTSMDTGSDHSCGVRTDSSIACWGLRIENSLLAEFAPPSGTFRSVSAGSHESCGMRTDGKVVCWRAYYWDAPTPPSATFQQISAGAGHVCGVLTNGRIACSGSNSHGQATPPA